MALTDGLIIQHNCEDFVDTIGSSSAAEVLSVNANTSIGGRTAWHFTDSAASVVKLANPPALNGTDWSVSVWFAGIAESSNWKTLLKSDGSSGHQVIIQANTNNLGAYSVAAGSFLDTGYDLIPAEHAGWTHIVVTASGGQTIFYINGSPAGSPIAMQSTTPIYAIGNYHTPTDPSGDQRWAEYLDDYRQWNRALLASEVATLYSATIDTTLSNSVAVGLKAEYTFEGGNDAPGTQLINGHEAYIDKTGNGHDLIRNLNNPNQVHPVLSDASQFGSQSILLDGNVSLEIPAAASPGPADAGVTFEFWMKVPMGHDKMNVLLESHALYTVPPQTKLDNNGVVVPDFRRNMLIHASYFGNIFWDAGADIGLDPNAEYPYYFDGHDGVDPTPHHPWYFDRVQAGDRFDSGHNPLPLATLNDGNFHHFVFTKKFGEYAERDLLANQNSNPQDLPMKIYIDGVDINASLGAWAGDFIYGLPLHVPDGQLAGYTDRERFVVGRQVVGNIDSFRIWDRELNSDEITHLSIGGAIVSAPSGQSIYSIPGILAAEKHMVFLEGKLLSPNQYTITNDSLEITDTGAADFAVGKKIQLIKVK